MVLCRRCACGLRPSSCKIHCVYCDCGRPKKGCKIHDPQYCACRILRTICKIHGGGGLCDCGIRRYDCKIHGNSFCKCGIKKTLCELHGGGALCGCGIQRSQCKLHGSGSIFCACGTTRSHCKLHGGSSFCNHDVQRSQCQVCNPHPCPIETCPRHEHPFGGARNLLRHLRAAHAADRKAVTKAGELKVHEFLRENGVDFQYQLFVPFHTCGLGSETACAYPDFYIARPWGHLFIEHDEHSHSHYLPSCDPRRDMDIYTSISLGTGGMVRILRYNPDAYHVGGVLRKVSTKERLETLLRFIQQETPPFPELPFARLFLYYDVDNEDSTLPTVAKEWNSETLRLLSFVLRCNSAADRAVVPNAEGRAGPRNQPSSSSSSSAC